MSSSTQVLSSAPLSSSVKRLDNGRGERKSQTHSSFMQLALATHVVFVPFLLLFMLRSFVLCQHLPGAGFSAWKMNPEGCFIPF